MGFGEIHKLVLSPDSKIMPIDILVCLVFFVLQFLRYSYVSVAWDLQSDERGNHAIAPTLFFVEIQCDPMWSNAIAPTLFFIELRSNKIQCGRTDSSPNEKENPKFSGLIPIETVFHSFLAFYICSILEVFSTIFSFISKGTPLNKGSNIVY